MTSGIESIAEIKRQLFVDDAKDSAKAPVPNQCLMIIDDNADIIEALTCLLEDRYRLVICHSYEAARERLNPEINVALLDIKMAGRDGIEAFGLLRQARPNLRIIFHSAYAGSSRKAHEVEHLSHSGYLTKGEYNAPELMDIIEMALDEG